MMVRWLTRRRVVLIVMLALLMGGTALLVPALQSPVALSASVSGAASGAVSNAVLGDDWTCSSFAFLTTCTRIEMAPPVGQGLAGNSHGRPGA